MAAAAKNPIEDWFLLTFKDQERGIRTITRALERLEIPASVEEKVAYYLDAVDESYEKHPDIGKFDGFNERTYRTLLRNLRKPSTLRHSLVTLLKYEKAVVGYLKLQEPSSRLPDKMREEKICGLLRFDFDRLLTMVITHREAYMRRIRIEFESMAPRRTSSPDIATQ